jgi:hypothetical protein
MGRFDAVVSCLPRAPARRRMPGPSTMTRRWSRWRRRGGGRRAFRAALGDLRAETAVGVPACETGLRGAGRVRLTYSIVRPTAFFKSLSGQVARVRAGKPFLLFGDGTLTACKPISDDDLGAVHRILPDRSGQGEPVLPVGGPGPALTAREQGEMLFAAAGMEPRFRQVPVAMMDAIIGLAAFLGRFSAKWADRAEFARTGRYYATESMLVWDAAAERYDADAAGIRHTLAAVRERHPGRARGARRSLARPRCLREHAVFCPVRNTPSRRGRSVEVDGARAQRSPRISTSKPSR